jgi:hypothetical protein
MLRFDSRGVIHQDREGYDYTAVKVRGKRSTRFIGHGQDTVAERLMRARISAPPFHQRSCASLAAQSACTSGGRESRLARPAMAPKLLSDAGHLCHRIGGN